MARHRRKPARPAPVARRRELVIERIGHRGDGVAMADGTPVYVPFTLAGERVLADVAGERAKLVEILQPSPDRIAPLCPHFSVCGGCALQHWAAKPYLEWKRQQVLAALEARGLEIDVAPTVAIDPATRRRAVLAAVGTRGGMGLGYHARASHDIVDIAVCPVMTPPLAALLQPLRDLLAPALAPGAKATLTLTASSAGIDLAIDGAAQPSAPRVLARLVESAALAGIVRLVWNGEPLLQVAAPVQDFDGTSLLPPPGGFLQVSREGEAALWSLVRAGVGEARRVADLFAGCGTFALRLARTVPVTAVEGDAAALAALEQAARQPGLKPVTVLRRDLFAEPLRADEFSGFDAVVFDSPFAGAQAQAGALAQSRVERIVAVSCNPATFARDARLLVDGGFKLKSVTPVDQFAFSPHIELVGAFARV